MKKAIKRIIIALGVVLGLSVTFVGGVYASQYINWGGTEAYHNTLTTLEQIITRGQVLKSERDTANQINEQLVNQISDKENVILDRENKINSKQQELVAKQQELEAKQREVEAKQREVEAKQRDVEAKQQTINELNTKITELESQDKTEELEQAIKDMQAIDQKANDALNSLN